ncbi:hypothetical protein KIPB_006782, partial [Kipferlia bialata]
QAIKDSQALFDSGLALTDPQVILPLIESGLLRRVFRLDYKVPENE